jgi:hypothetical protein
MRGNKLVIWVVCATIAVLAAAAAIYVFRNEIADCCSELRNKIDKKRLRRDGEYADFADL